MKKPSSARDFNADGIVDDLKRTINMIKPEDSNYHVYEYIKELSLEAIQMLNDFNMRYRIEIHRVVDEMYSYGYVTTDTMIDYLRNSTKHCDADVQFVKAMFNEDTDKCFDIVKNMFLSKYISDDVWYALVDEHFKGEKK
jgi:hypothetical protein